MSKIIEKLKNVVGVGRIMIGDSIAERPTSFWNHDPTQAKAIVLPITTDEVSAILHCCHNHEQSVVVQGGLTNCVAAAESTLDDVVLSLEKMTRIDEIDVIGCTAVVEAGAILQ
ncbi:MAG: FAD-binding oxidoreductase, partial [Proteobacteria bacterium]|nr:FAD-binding oxidoreductase [Pseudomonadota bacterium]